MAVNLTRELLSSACSQCFQTPCAAYINKETAKHYSAEGLFIGVPIKIGENGVEHIYKALQREKP